MTDEEARELTDAVYVALRRLEAVREAVAGSNAVENHLRKQLDERFVEVSGGKPVRNDPSLGVFQARLRAEIDKNSLLVEGLMSQLSTSANRVDLEQQIRAAQERGKALRKQSETLR